MPFNAHRVFTNTGETGGYLGALKVDPNQEHRLTGARDDIRQALRQGFQDWPRYVTRDELVSGLPTHWSVPALRPKFRMQGSFAYRTHVDPETMPPQQVDLDDGMFLPQSFVSRNGRLEPMVSSAALFKLVEAILKPLCQTKGWHLDTQKPSCVRIELSNIEHVDIALYAISDDEFSKLVEKAALAQVGDVATTRQRIQDSMALDDLLYASLSEEGIALAHRKQGWKRSDPRKLDEWFHECMRTFGEPFRRISRYLKGWRDFAFVESRLASIALMAAVEAAFLRGAELNPQRDDRTLHAVASTLSETLSKPIPNPVVSGARLDEGWDEAERKQYIEAAKELARLLQFALYDAKSQSDVIDVLRSAFGRRVPNDQSLVTLEEFELETKSAVLAMPAIAKPASEERMTRLDAAFAKSENSGYRARPWAGRHK